MVSSSPRASGLRSVLTNSRSQLTEIRIAFFAYDRLATTS